MKHKRFYKSICLLLLSALLCLCLFGGLKVNASTNAVNLRQKITFDIDTNVDTHEWWSIFTINGYEDNDSTIYYSLFGFSYNEGNDHVEGTQLSIKPVANNEDYFELYEYGQNTNITLYSKEAYLFLYKNSTRGIYIYHVKLRSDKHFYVADDNELYISPLVYSTRADWYSGQLSEYTSKKIFLYGQTINKTTADSDYTPNMPTLNDYKPYLNAVLSVYMTNDYLGDLFAQGRQEGYSSGYYNGYQAGYSAGEQGLTDFDRVWAFLSGTFTAIGAIFSIELFPHVPLGIFILVPLFFGAVGFVLWVWRRN